MYIGIDIGGTKIKVASAREGLALTKTLLFPAPQDSQKGLEIIKKAITEVSVGQPIAAIGLSVPGVVDHTQGVLVFPPNLQIWKGLALEKEIGRSLNVPCVINNDADLGALAEATAGSGQGYRHVLYVTISTGVGTGIIIDGQIYTGTYGSEGGHMIIDPNGPVCSCGGKGHLEAIIAGPAIKRRFGKQAYEIKDKATWDEITRDMAMGIISMANLLSPDIIVLGGGVSTHYDLFGDLLNKHVAELATMSAPPKIVPAKYVEEAPLYGALLAAQNLTKK